jgi:hypothetical protein
MYSVFTNSDAPQNVMRNRSLKISNPVPIAGCAGYVLDHLNKHEDEGHQHGLWQLRRLRITEPDHPN